MQGYRWAHNLFLLQHYRGPTADMQLPEYVHGQHGPTADMQLPEYIHEHHRPTADMQLVSSSKM